MAATVKENITAASLKSLQPFIYDQDDFDEPDGTWLVTILMYNYCDFL